MDGSRVEDLKQLHRLFNDPSKPLDVRSAAHRSFMNIQKQFNDRKLADLRLMLIKASRVSDHEASEKLERQIQEYSLKKGYIKQIL